MRHCYATNASLLCRQTRYFQWKAVVVKPLQSYTHRRLLGSFASTHAATRLSGQTKHFTVRTYTKYCDIKRMTASAKPELKMFKIDRPEFKTIFTPELEALIALFKKYDYEIRIAGGAVRDLLSGKVPADIDFATTATPDEMKNMFTREGIRMINMKGESHGTITARINDQENFEVTTLRIDVVTDGRRAQVEYTKDWELDALRRDLTINSMFLGFDGTVYDYFNGKDDLAAKRVQFVGNAVDRIQEDYLRILRYFRFYGRIAETENAHDADTLRAIRENVEGLQRVSGERIWMELKKILAGSFAGPIIKVMLETGIAKPIGLPPSCNVSEMETVYNRSKDLELKPMTLLAALLETEEQLLTVNERLKVSRDEINLALFILSHRHDDRPTDMFAYSQDLYYAKGSGPKLKANVCELLKYWNQREALEKFTSWEAGKLPITGHILQAAGVPKGPTLAKALDAVREKWKETRYTATREELMPQLDDIIKDFKAKS